MKEFPSETKGPVQIAEEGNQMALFCGVQAHLAL